MYSGTQKGGYLLALPMWGLSDRSPLAALGRHDREARKFSSSTGILCLQDFFVSVKMIQLLVFGKNLPDEALSPSTTVVCSSPVCIRGEAPSAQNAALHSAL